MPGVASKGTQRILLVEDDPSLSTSLCYSLEAAGYLARVALTGEEALTVFANWSPDLILLDVQLPGMSGYEVCRSIRGQKDIRQPAIIIVTAKAQETDRVAGFEVGADDFVTKPFSLSELLLRIHARLHGRTLSEARNQRAQGSAAEYRAFAMGPLEIDQMSHRVFLSGVEINLSVQEMRLLAYLASEPGKMRSRREILTSVWDYHPEAASRTLDTHIKRLRDKFGQLASMIQTVHGVGYRLTLPTPAPSDPASSSGRKRRR
jgi:two-component system phosphate regulon response regulator PhoB